MNELSASEALFGFAGWLTARDEQVVFSARDNAAPAAELVAEFCKVNGLAEPREDWTTRLTMPPTSTLTKRAADVLCTCGSTPVVGGAEVCLFCGLPKVAHR